MIIYVFDRSFTVIGMIEDYYSLTWAERYDMCGDFELELPIVYDGSELIKFGNLLCIASSDICMVIQDLKPESSDNKTSLIVKGESVEALLKQRVLLYHVNFAGYADEVVYEIMTEHITAPEDANRQFPIFKTTFPPIGMLGTFNDQVEIQTVYDAVTLICKDSEYGFKAIREDNKLAFFVYEGVDRSYNQSANPFVIFSDGFDNVIASSFYLSIKDKVNTVHVTTDDSEHAGLFVWEEGVLEWSAYERFEELLETTVDRELDPENILDDADVLAILETRARALIKERKTVGVFEGDFDIQGNFKYGEDFFMGDIVQCFIEGRGVRARIIELVQSYSAEGEKTYVAMDFITT